MSDRVLLRLKLIDFSFLIYRLRLKALTLERSNLDDQFQEKKVDLIKREDVAVASDQRLVSLGMKFFPGRYIYPKKTKLFTYNVLFL